MSGTSTVISSDVWEQYSNLMRVKLISLKYFEQFEDSDNTTKLLMKARAVWYKYKGHGKPYLVLNNAKSSLYLYFQKTYKSNTSHYNTFQALTEVVEHHGGILYHYNALTKIKLEKRSDNQEAYR